MEGINATGASLQAGMSNSIMKKSMDFQANMVNKLMQGGLEAASSIRSDAMASQGIGQNLNISV